MTSFFTFKHAGKVFKVLKDDKTLKTPIELCEDAGFTLARIDDDAFVYVKKMLDNYNIRRIIFTQNAGKNDCFLSYKGEKLLEYIKTVCNEDIRNQLVLCQESFEGQTIKLFTQTTTTVNNESEIGLALTIVLVVVGVAVLACCVLILKYIKKVCQRRTQNAQRNQQVCLT